MDFTMKDIDQEIIKFNYDGNFKEDDFYVSKSNKQIFDLLNTFGAQGFDNNDEDQMMGEIAAKRQSWRYSKLSGLRFLAYLCDKNVDADRAVKELYLFGGSASDHSSIYYKYS